MKRVRIKITRTWLPADFLKAVIALLETAGANEFSFRFATARNATVGITHIVARPFGGDPSKLEEALEELKLKHGVKAPVKVLVEEDSNGNNGQEGQSDPEPQAPTQA